MNKSKDKTRVLQNDKKKKNFCTAQMETDIVMAWKK